MHEPGNSSQPAPQESPGSPGRRVGARGPCWGGAGGALQASQAPAPRPAHGPVVASPAGGSRPQAALGMLRRRPGRAASELPCRPHARPTWAPRAPGCGRYGPARPQRAGTGLGRLRPGRPATPRPHGPGRSADARAGWRARRPGSPAPRRGGEGAPAALTWRAGAEGRRAGQGRAGLAGPGGARPAGVRDAAAAAAGVGVRCDRALARALEPCASATRAAGV